MAEETDKDVSEVAEENDQSEDTQSEETEKEQVSLEKMNELVKALQKGYTETRQEFAQTREDLQTFVDTINKQTGAVSGEDEYLTVGRLRQILAEQSNAETQERTQADAYVEQALNQLKVEGKINSKEEEDELLQYALKIKEPDLLKAAAIYEDIKQARIDAKKEAAKAKVKQEEGSKIGTSSKATTGEQGGIDYQKVRNMDWFNL